MVLSKRIPRHFYSLIITSDMCEAHRHMAATAVAERTPVRAKAIEASPEDKDAAAGDAIANLIMTFGYERIQKALKSQTPPPTK